MTKSKSYEEIVKIATETFGEDAEVIYSRGQGWVIYTGLEESRDDFDWELYKDTPAWEAYNEPDSGGENVLERWARKNGYGYDHMGAIVDAYNADCAKLFAEHVEMCKGYLTRRGISWEGMTNETIVRAASNELDIEYGRV